MGKSRRSRSRAATSFRLRRCWKIHWEGFSENRPSRVLPTITEMIVMCFISSVWMRNPDSSGFLPGVTRQPRRRPVQNEENNDGSRIATENGQVCCKHAKTNRQKQGSSIKGQARNQQQDAAAHLKQPRHDPKPLPDSYLIEDFHHCLHASELRAACPNKRRAKQYAQN